MDANKTTRKLQRKPKLKEINKCNFEIGIIKKDVRLKFAIASKDVRGINVKVRFNQRAKINTNTPIINDPNQTSTKLLISPLRVNLGQQN